jgi:4-hydroxy-tetrahydrodipicolinate synthase
MKQLICSGTGVALVTPFRQDGSVDYAALERLIEHVVTGGVDFIVSLGTTGEAITLSAKECREVFDFTIEKLNGRKPLIAGLFGSNYTQKLVDGVRNYNLDGFDAIMSSSPAYNKPPQEGIFQHYMALAEVSPLPIIIYNVPGRTGSNVEAETVLRLAEASDKFIAVKEASGDLVQGSQILKHRPDHFMVLSGDDPTALPLTALGGEGVISVIANLYPERWSTMIRAARSGDLATATQIHLDLLDVHPWLYADCNPSGVKAGLEILGICRKDVRIPLTPQSPENYAGLKEAMEQVSDTVTV